MDTLKCQQELRNPKWGQITSIVWIFSPPPMSSFEPSISIGTGRGVLTLIQAADTKHRFNRSLTNSIFPINDVIEGQAYDPLNSRLVVASHNGDIKLFTVEKPSA